MNPGPTIFGSPTSFDFLYVHAAAGYAWLTSPDCMHGLNTDTHNPLCLTVHSTLLFGDRKKGDTKPAALYFVPLLMATQLPPPL